ncbi:hypothetical protein Ancab_021726, partial [Ancistrocladus abbreviatus]
PMHSLLLQPPLQTLWVKIEITDLAPGNNAFCRYPKLELTTWVRGMVQLPRQFLRSVCAERIDIFHSQKMDH